MEVQPPMPAINYELCIPWVYTISGLDWWTGLVDWTARLYSSFQNDTVVHLNGVFDLYRSRHFAAWSMESPQHSYYVYVYMYFPELYMQL